MIKFSAMILFLTLVSDVAYMTTSGVSNKGQNVIPSTLPHKTSKMNALLKVVAKAADEEINLVSNTKVKIAIIGGGINGGLFSYYLHQLMENADIHIYNHHISGQEPVENSSLVIHNRQKYMMEIVKKFELSTKNVPRLQRNILMYDGLDNWLLTFDKNYFSKWVTSFVEKQFENLEKLYRRQEKNYFKDFDNLADLVNFISPRVKEFMDISTAQCLKEKRWPMITPISKRFDTTSDQRANINIINSLLLINYGQDLNSHGFAGLTSIIFSEISGKLLTITTPINEIIRKLMGNADRFFNCNVTKVTNEEDSIQITIDNDKKSTHTYDYLVIGTPEIENIEFSEFETPIQVCQNQKMVFTKLNGSLKFSNARTAVATGIANVRDNKFRVASKISDSRWNILHNSEPLDVADILNVTNILSVDHKAVWPDYSNRECVTESKFVLTNRLYYLNAIEWASCLLEMKAIGARNVAISIYYKEKLQGRKRKLKRPYN